MTHLSTVARRTARLWCEQQIMAAIDTHLIILSTTRSHVSPHSIPHKRSKYALGPTPPTPTPLTLPVPSLSSPSPPSPPTTTTTTNDPFPSSSSTSSSPLAVTVNREVIDGGCGHAPLSKRLVRSRNRQRAGEQLCRVRRCTRRKSRVKRRSARELKHGWLSLSLGRCGVGLFG